MVSPFQWFENVTKGLRRGRRRQEEPPRDTFKFPNFFPLGQPTNQQRIVYKPTPRNLRYFSKTPYARRAINTVKNPIKQLKWEVAPLDGIELNSELKRQIAAATACFTNPNNDDTSETFIEQIVEDWLVGAAAFETQLSGDESRPVWMWPVDGLSIQVYPGWTGDRSEARYAQTMGYGSYSGAGVLVPLRDDELVYMRPNPSTATPFGLGPLEVAFMTIARQLGLADFQGNLTSNARPGVMINLGEVSDKTVLEQFRAYWRNDVEGQGMTPIAGMKGGDVLRLHPEGDNGLFLKYQEMLKREIAVAFDLSPQNLGVEHDVNRSQGEVAEDRDWAQAIRPQARSVSSTLTTQVVHRRMGFSQLQYRFTDLDREDEKAAAEIHKIYYQTNTLTPNEIRKRIGEEPSDNPFCEMTDADVQIAIAAARGAQQVDDDNLTGGEKRPAKKQSRGSSKEK